MVKVHVSSCDNGCVKTQTWCRRLTVQLPGWKVWRAGPPGEGWYAVPAPPGTDLDAALKMEYRIGPFPRPQRLRDEARLRYADGDTCQSCNQDWRLCGHRTEETRDSWNMR